VTPAARIKGRGGKSSGACVSPLAVLTAIIMGSAITIAVGLAMVLVVFLVLSGEQPRLALELRHLFVTFLLFVVLAVVSSAAFWAVIKGRRWWWPAQFLTYLALALIAFYYWPR
jgi:hypothetical protein